MELNERIMGVIVYAFERWIAEIYLQKKRGPL